MGPKILKSDAVVAVHAWLPAMHASRASTGSIGLEALGTL